MVSGHDDIAWFRYHMLIELMKKVSFLLQKDSEANPVIGANSGKSLSHSLFISRPKFTEFKSTIWMEEFL